MKCESGADIEEGRTERKGSLDLCELEASSTLHPYNVSQQFSLGGVFC